MVPPPPVAALNNLSLSGAQPDKQTLIQTPSEYVGLGVRSSLVDDDAEYEKIKATLRFKDFAPFYDSEYKEEPYPEFPFSDPGLKADPELRGLFKHGVEATTHQELSASEQLVKYGYSVEHLTPKFGAEITGIQLSQLDEQGKNDLARYVAERGVVAFRDQDLRELGPEAVIKYAEHFGHQHVHPTSAAPKNYPELHLVYRDDQNQVKTRRAFDRLRDRVSSIAWHSDVSYERQPPGTTFLAILESPQTGGDTLFADQEEIYNRLSPEFRERLEGLQAIHSGVDQVNYSIGKGGIVRRQPVENPHPVVRTHPVTGNKSIYVNSQFTRSIVGYKKEESDFLLNFLYDTIAKTADAHVRVRWHDGTVVVWDNRRTAHSAIVDWDSVDGAKRHLFRLTPQADIPK